jgi:hypothetical protein
MFKKFFQSAANLLWGPQEKVGAGFKWKQACFSFAIGMTLYAPMFTYYNSMSYQGEMPPAAPLIREFGVFEYNPGTQALKKRPFVRLNLINGNSYMVEDGPNLLGEIFHGTEATSLLYIEGFLLKNGKGNFWPNVVKDLNGNNVVDEGLMRRDLLGNRNAFGPLLLYMYLFLLPFWVISICNIFVLTGK